MNTDVSRRTVIASAIKAVAATAIAGVAVRRGTDLAHSTPRSGENQTLAAVARHAVPQPFTPESIWGQPIGSAAVYVPAGVDRTPASHAPMPHAHRRPSGAEGAIRLGELRPGSAGPRHALNIGIATHRYLCRAGTAADTFRWPAIDCDIADVGFHGSHTDNMNTAMRLGVLLALRPASSLPTRLRTEPGRQLAWTFQNYGGYVTEGTGDAVLISTEEGRSGSFTAQFLCDWAFPFDHRANDETAWVDDIEDILVALHAVDNNSPTSVGGGGTPRQPLTPSAPPITPVSTY